jgi:hypothetical protein
MKDLELMFDSNNPCFGKLGLMLLEGLYYQKDYHLTLWYIDQLDRAVGHDPYLNYFRASLFRSMDKPVRSEWYLNKFISDLPEKEEGYLSLLELYMESARYTDATNLLDNIIDLFGFYKEDLKPLFQNFPDFINSMEYTQWINKG